MSLTFILPSVSFQQHLFPIWTEFTNLHKNQIEPVPCHHDDVRYSFSPTMIPSTDVTACLKMVPEWTLNNVGDNTLPYFSLFFSSILISAVMTTMFLQFCKLTFLDFSILGNIGITEYYTGVDILLILFNLPKEVQSELIQIVSATAECCIIQL